MLGLVRGSAGPGAGWGPAPGAGPVAAGGMAGPAGLGGGALTWLLEVERRGGPHLVLAPAAVWYPPGEQDEQHATAREEIAALGWYDRRKRLEIEVAVALAMLCRAESEFFGW